ncbi:hypothetical protein DL98DRAFT_567742 [Cadophora sp. DSE1049]|nr:hypothetical protein DL98DRAFT_567742 [Cadophora sp. DSE1049]
MSPARFLNRSVPTKPKPFICGSVKGASGNYVHPKCRGERDSKAVNLKSKQAASSMEHLSIPIEELSHALPEVSGFHAYPSRVDVDIHKICSIAEEEIDFDWDDWAPFLQAWLWFGLLAESLVLLGPDLQPDLSLPHDQRAAANVTTLLVTTSSDNWTITTKNLYSFIALPYCQLASLQLMADDISGFDAVASLKVSHVPFWIDTLCLPVQSQIRLSALRHLRQVYSSASKVIAVDPLLYRCSLASFEVCIFRIRYSPWTQKLWTFQEGALARELYIKFRNRSYQLDEIFDGYDKLEPASRLLP